MSVPAYFAPVVGELLHRKDLQKKCRKLAICLTKSVILTQKSLLLEERIVSASSIFHGYANIPGEKTITSMG